MCDESVRFNLHYSYILVKIVYLSAFEIKQRMHYAVRSDN